MIAWDAVDVRFGRSRGVGPVSFAAGDGQWLGLIGPNGAGKSTLLRAAAGLVRYQGRLLAGGVEVSGLGHRARSRCVAMVPQRPTIPDDMTVAEYVMLGRTAFVPAFGSESVRDRVVVGELLDRLDLTTLAGRRLGQISGGEIQRAVLGRALAQEAPILLLDEPTAALDLGHVQDVLDLVDGLRAERALTVVSAMHELTLAAQYADELVLLDRGLVSRAGPPHAVLDEATIADVYGARVAVTLAHGRPVVTPQRRAVP